MHYDGIADKRVLVTAAGGGIGETVAHAFADHGAHVFGCDVTEAGVAAMRARHGAEAGLIADVSDAAQVDVLFDTAVGYLGGLDIVVACAGIAGPTAKVQDVTPAEWDACVGVNLRGAYLCARRAVPLLEAAGGGSLILFSSTAGLAGYPLRTPYAASKWGIIGLAKSISAEAGPNGVRVNAVCPGSVSGPRMDGVIAREAAETGQTPDAVRAGYTKDTALRTFVDADDIAATILFVCSDAGRRIAGQALTVDGHTLGL
jgi:NAD(P)-dependent dehydrogenase (short-subunit alcohol dehydrogenase family)